jgi:UDP-glucose 4-epimerase
MVVPRFVRAALRNEDITIYGSGTQSRCFSYVGDVIEAAKALMESGRAFGGIYNIGSEQEVTIEQLADRIIELTGSKSQKRFIGYDEAYGRPFDDMMRRVPALDKIRNTVGYCPRYSLDDILIAVIEFEKARIERGA